MTYKEVAKRKEYLRNYRLAHREQARERNAVYYLAHADELREYSRKYGLTHREQHREANRKWRMAHPKADRKRYWAHPEEYREKARKYQMAHPEKRLEASRKWNEAHPEKRQLMHAKDKARRRRDFPTNYIIGLPAKGSVLHHMTTEIAVYIPEVLHKSFPHRLSNPESMNMINWRAMEWIGNRSDEAFLKENVGV